MFKAGRLAWPKSYQPSYEDNSESLEFSVDMDKSFCFFAKINLAAVMKGCYSLSIYRWPWAVLICNRSQNGQGYWSAMNNE